MFLFNAHNPKSFITNHYILNSLFWGKSVQVYIIIFLLWQYINCILTLHV
jgi:hypothetical protein